MPPASEGGGYSTEAPIGTGVAVDKILALTGQTAALQIANIVMPSPEEQAERRAMHASLDAIAAKLRSAPAPRLARIALGSAQSHAPSLSVKRAVVACRLATSSPHVEVSIRSERRRLRDGSVHRN